MTNQMPNSNMNNGMNTMPNVQPTQPTVPVNNVGAANSIPTGQNGMNSGMPVNNGMTGQMPNSNMNNGMGTMQNMQPTQPIAPIANGLNNPSAAWNQGQSQSAEVPFPEQGTNNDPTPNTNSAQDYFNHNA